MPVALSALSACSLLTTTVKLTVVNPSTVPVVVDVTNLDDNGRPLRADSLHLASASPALDPDGKVLLGADGQPQVKPTSVQLEWTGVRRLSKLKLEYRPETSTARFALEPTIVVHDSPQPYTKEATIGTLRLYDRAFSEAALAQLANDLGGGASAALAERLVDVLPLLGTAVVATLKFDERGAEAAQVHGSVHLRDVPYEHAPLLQLRSSTTADRQMIASAAVAIPVFEPLATQMNRGEVCHLAWSVNHTPVQNVAFDFGAALEAAELAQLKSLRNLLVAYPNSTVLVISKMHVVESASFGVTPGQSIDERSSSAATSVFTGTSAYSFGLADEAYVSLPSLVANIWYNKETDRTSLLALLEKLIRNKTLAVPNGGTGSLKEAVRGGLAPIDLGNANVTREVLKQPKL